LQRLRRNQPLTPTDLDELGKMRVQAAVGERVLAFNRASSPCSSLPERGSKEIAPSLESLGFFVCHRTDLTHGA